MTKRLLGIGTAVTAIALTAGVAVAQRADNGQPQGGPPWQQGAQVQQQQPPTGPPPQQGVGQAGAAGQVGPGQGMGRGMGRGMGLGPGPGAGQGRGRGMGGPGRGMGPGAGMGPGRGGGRGFDARGGPGFGAGLGALLDLTADQQTAIRTLQRGTRDQAAGITDELDLTRKTLHRELFADKRDAAKVTALVTKVAALEKQLLDLHIKTQSSVADLLTPNQKETMRIRR